MSFFLLFSLSLDPFLNRCSVTLLFHLITLNYTLSLGRAPLDEGSARRRDPYLTSNIHNRQTDIHAPGGIRTRNPNKRAAADTPLNSAATDIDAKNVGWVERISEWRTELVCSSVTTVHHHIHKIITPDPFLS
jgi:hypothetical protein